MSRYEHRVDNQLMWSQAIGIQRMEPPTGQTFPMRVRDGYEPIFAEVGGARHIIGFRTTTSTAVPATSTAAPQHDRDRLDPIDSMYLHQPYTPSVLTDISLCDIVRNAVTEIEKEISADHLNMEEDLFSVE